MTQPNGTRTLDEMMQVRELFTRLDMLVQERVGARLFTVMAVDVERGTARRLYTNLPGAYAEGGEKPISPGPWFDRVLLMRDIFVANTHEEIAAVFPDAEQIRAAGCESCINIPVEVGGVVLGTLNLLHRAGYYTPERVTAAEALKLAGAVTLLALRDV